MPASSAGRNNAAALLGYVCVALAFAWPLPANASSALYGTPGGDTGVYVWNLWVFRHEIVGHGRFPFYTSEILALNSGAPLTLHNYTSLANVAAFPLLPLLGTVATYNVLMIASGAVSAFAGFVLFRRLSGDAAAAWIGGLLFGFSTFMTARSEHHFSLVQTAALPLFALALLRIEERPTTSRAVVAGALVAAAFLCDPYYAVYCLLMAAFAAAWLVITVERGAARAAPAGLRLAVNVAIMCLGGLVLGIVLRGGGRIDFMGLRVSMTRLYTPVLILTLLVLVRAWIALRPRVGWMPAAFHGLLRPATVAAAACTVMLSPVLTVMAAHIGERQWIAPRTFWRSSPAGLDLLAFLVPNPTSPVVGWMSAGWLASAPGGFIENVAAIPWTATFAVAIAILYAGWRPPRYWIWFTAGAALLALGPFVQIAGMSTYVPTPWAVLRYLPVIGAARMPPRFAARLGAHGYRCRLSARRAAAGDAQAARAADSILLCPDCGLPATPARADAAIRPARRDELHRQFLGVHAVLPDVPREAAARRLPVATPERRPRAVSPAPPAHRDDGPQRRPSGERGPHGRRHRAHPPVSAAPRGGIRRHAPRARFDAAAGLRARGVRSGIPDGRGRAGAVPHAARDGG